jgi:hypothetical protein
MQGLLYSYLHDFVERQFGEPVWERARYRAGIPERSFVPTRAYPDHYLTDLVTALQTELGERAPTREQLLFDFGGHVGRSFERDFDFYFRRFVSAHDMIAGIEPIIHSELRRHDPFSRPPTLHTRPAPGGALWLVYDSSRRLCDMLRGLAIQVGAAFGERVTIEEPLCMNRGDPWCELLLRFSRTGSPQSAASPP